MIATTLAEVRKGLLVYVSEPLQPVFMILIPVLIVYLASYAIQGLVTSSERYTLPVMDLDQTRQSSEVINTLENEGQLKLSVQRDSSQFDAAAAAKRLGGGRRIAVLVIPKGAGDAITAGRDVEFPLYVDPTQDTRYGLVLLAVERALFQYGAPQAAVTIVADAAGVPRSLVEREVSEAVRTFLSDPPVQISERATTRGRSLPNAYDQTVPGIALMWTMGSLAYATWTADDERRIHHTWKRALATPASRFGMVIGKFVVVYMLNALVLGSLFAIGGTLFGVDVGSMPTLALVLGTFAMVPSGVAVLLAVSGVDRQLAFVVSNVGMFVIGALSGALVPLYVLPRWLEELAIISPLYWAKEAAQDVMIRGADLSDVMMPVAALGLIAIAVIAASGLRFRTARA